MRLLKSVRSQLGNYHLKSGIYHFYRNEFKQAIEFFDKALQNPEKLDEADLRMTRYYLTQTRITAGEEAEEAGDLRRAIESYEAALTDSASYPDLHFRIGLLRVRLGEMEEAVAALRRAIEVHPAYLEARIQLAFTLLSCARAVEALSEFDQVRALTLSAIEEPYRAALDAAARGDLAETAERMRDAFQRRPQNFAYHYRRGLKSLQAGRFEAAAEELKQAVLFNPRFADVRNYLGVAYGEMGQQPAAIAEFRQAIECNPDYLAARLNLAFTLAERNEVKEAVCELKAVLSKEPSNQVALSKLEELDPGREGREDRMRIP